MQISGFQPPKTVMFGTAESKRKKLAPLAGLLAMLGASLGSSPASADMVRDRVTLTPKASGRVEADNTTAAPGENPLRDWQKDACNWIVAPNDTSWPIRRAFKPDETLNAETNRFYRIANCVNAIDTSWHDPAVRNPVLEALARIDTTQLDQVARAFYLQLQAKMNKDSQEVLESRGYQPDPALLAPTPLAREMEASWSEIVANQGAERRCPPPPSNDRQEIKPSFADQRGVGICAYESILAYEHQTPIRADDLIALGKAQYAALDAQLQALAKEIDPAATDWRDVLDERCRATTLGSAEEIIERYKQEVADAWAFLKSHGLFPANNTFLEQMPKVELTRVEDAGRYPFAAYNMMNHTFNVTVHTEATPRDPQMDLETHCTDSMKPTAVHEAYPGHHLQVLMDIIATKYFLSVPYNGEYPPLRQEVQAQLSGGFNDDFYTEGWGHYAEYLMLEQGFYKTNEEKLQALANFLWRTARVFLDAQLHTGQIKPEEAVQFMVKNLRMEEDRARSEIQRYLDNPGDVVAYNVGMLQILKIRELALQQNPGMTLAEFHGKLLGGPDFSWPTAAMHQFGIAMPPVSELKSPFLPS